MLLYARTQSQLKLAGNRMPPSGAKINIQSNSLVRIAIFSGQFLIGVNTQDHMGKIIALSNSIYCLILSNRFRDRK